jgi:hypothetical protein
VNAAMLESADNYAGIKLLARLRQGLRLFLGRMPLSHFSEFLPLSL